MRNFDTDLDRLGVTRQISESDLSDPEQRKTLVEGNLAALRALRGEPESTSEPEKPVLEVVPEPEPVDPADDLAVDRVADEVEIETPIESLPEPEPEPEPEPRGRQGHPVEVISWGPLTTLFQGDCREVLATFPDACLDAVVCDPPYGLSKEPDIAEVLTHWLAGDDYVHTGGGFMGKSWDSFVPGPATWREVLRVLKPGGYLLAFAGTRTMDLMGMAIRMAGFEMRDCLTWLYGSGFPKSMDVSKAIDKRRMSDVDAMRAWIKGLGSREDVAAAAGVTPRQVDHWVGENTPCPQMLSQKRFEALCAHFGNVPDWADSMFERVGELRGYVTHGRSGGADFAKVVGVKATPKMVEDRELATDVAQQWKGWGTALKPAYEPIIMARKPLIGTVAANVLEYGTGALNIDATRIASNGDKLGGGAESKTTKAQKGNEGWTRPWMEDEQAQEAHASRVRDNVAKAEQKGRWPANVLLTHNEDCEQVGTKKIKSGTAVMRNRDGGVHNEIYGKYRKPPGDDVSYAGEDGKEEVAAWNCTPDCPVAMLDEQSGVLTSGKAAKGGHKRSAENMDKGSDVYGGGRGISGTSTTDDAGLLYGDKGGASRFFYQAKAAKKERNLGLPEGMKNDHPTVKPMEVMRWLVRMVTAPGGVICDPFNGSGTTGMAARIEGLDYIGIELDAHNLDISRHRIRAIEPGGAE